MQEFWYCCWCPHVASQNESVKLEQYINRYSSNPYFIISKKNIEGSLNNAIAVKKINPSSVEKEIVLATKYFKSFPEADDIECVSTVCPK